MSLKDHSEYAAHGKSEELKLKRAAPAGKISSSEIDSGAVTVKCKYLRPLARHNYCQTKKRLKNLSTSELNISGKSYAEKMCLESGISNESQSDSLPGEGEGHVSSFADDSLKLEGNGYSLSRDEGTSSCTEIDSDDAHKNTNSAMNQHSTDSDSPDSNFGDSTLKNKTNEACAEKECPVCCELFTDLHKFTLHLKEAHKNSKNANVCIVCNKELSSSSSLDRHLLIHSGEKPHRCEICGQQFSTNGNMNRHMRTHQKRKLSGSSSGCESEVKKQKNVQANQSASISVSENEMKITENQECKNKMKKRKGGNGTKSSSTGNEVKKVELQEYESNMKKQKSANKNHYETPNSDSEIDVQETEVQECKSKMEKDEIFKCDANLKEEKNSDNSKTSNFVAERNVTDAEVHKCKVCIRGFKHLTNVSFSSKSFPLIARIDCEKNRRCPFDKNADEVALLTDNMHLPKTCKKCNISFPCTRSLNMHMEAHNYKHSLKCKECGAVFCSHEDYTSHQLRNRSSHCKRKVASKSEFMNALGLNGEDHFHEGRKAPIFFKSFFRKAEIQKIYENALSFTPLSHEETLQTTQDIDQTENNDFADISSIVSLTSQSSIPNIRSSPITAEPASPQNSDVISAGPSLPLSADQAISDSPQNEMASSIQSEILDTNQMANVQASTSSMEESVSSENENLNFKEVNQKNEDGSKSLKKLKTHPTKKKIHRCEYCFYTSIDKSTLSRHMRTHNGERPFKCSICDYAFTTKANTHRHIRQRHQIPKTKEHKYAVYNTNKSRTKLSNVVCSFCNLSFDHDRARKHHVRSSNSCQNKPWICLVCKHGFSTKNNCMRHVNAQHPGYSKHQYIWRNKYSSSKKDDKLSGLDSNDVSSCDQTEIPMIHSKDDVKEEQDDMPENLSEFEDAEQMITETSDCITEMFPNSSTPVTALHTTEPHTNIAENQTQADHVVQQHSNENVDKMQANHISPLLSTSISQNLTEGSSLLNPETVPKLKIKTKAENDAAKLMLEFQLHAVHFQPIDLTLRPLDLSVNKSVAQHPNGPEVSQKLRHCPEFTEKFPEPPPAHMSTFISKIDEFNPLHYHAINLSTHLVAPTSFCPTQYSTPNQSVVNSAPAPVLSREDSVKEKIPKKDIQCQYCRRLFSTKSNKERHIRKQHSLHAKFPKHKSMPVPATAELPKQAQNVSDSTKDRLRSVLIPKVASYQNSQDDDSLGSESALYIVENEPNTDSSNEANSTDNSFLNHSSKNDYENNDLASVSSVIDTANSQAINKFLKDASLTDEHTPKFPSYRDNDVESNMKKDTDRKVKQYACEICKQTFSSSNSRDRHANTHTREKKFACSDCDKKFSTKSNLGRHKKNKCCSKLKNCQNSYGEKLESLENASQSFNLSGSFNKDFLDFNRFHENRSLNPLTFSFLNHHVGATDLNTDLKNLKQSLQNLSQKQELECRFCNNTYKNDDDLTNHLKELHPLEYKSSIGETIYPEDTILSLKKNGLMKKRLS